MDPSEERQTFLEHLEDLRWTLIRGILWWIPTIVVGFFFAKPFLEVVMRPMKGVTQPQDEKVLVVKVAADGTLRLEGGAQGGAEDLSKFRLRFEWEGSDQSFVFGPDYRTNFFYFRPIDPIMLVFKAALILSIVLAMPLWLWEVWKFIKPGLFPRERKVVRGVILLGCVLFPVGVAFAYMFLGFVLSFLLTSVQIAGLEPRLDIGRYLDFALMLMGAFGAVFELPVVMILLARLGVVSAEFLRTYRKHAIVIIAVVAMVITPPDPVSMMAVMVPLLLLYELSIWLIIPFSRAKAGEKMET